MSANLRLVVNAAKADPDILLSEGAGNRSRDGSLTCSGRSHKAEDRACAFLCESTDRKEFQHTVLNLLQTIMVLLKDLFRVNDILIIP